MDKIKVTGFHQHSFHILVDDPPPPHIQTPPNFTSYKMPKGCRNDYIEAFGAVYCAKKAV